MRRRKSSVDAGPENDTIQTNDLPTIACPMQASSFILTRHLCVTFCVQKLVNQVDTDGDGTIDFQEFIALMQRARQSLVREPEKWEGNLHAYILARQHRHTMLLWSERQHHPVTTCHRKLAVNSSK